MRALYREQMIRHGDYATVSVYPVFHTGRKRGGRYRATSDVQKRLNEFNARERLGRQLDAHMHENDGFWRLSFDDKFLPKTREECIRTWQTFKKRLARYYKREGLGEMKLGGGIHGDAGGNRLHIHVCVNAEIPASAMAALWGLGFVEVTPIYFGKRGLRGLAEYIMNGIEWGRVLTTRNLTDPAPRERTGRISKTEAEDIYDNWDRKDGYEGRWPGYAIAEVKPFYNWFNRYYYLRVYLYRQEAKK